MSNIKNPKRAVGGSAAERGMDFQARVSAIVMAHLVAERPIGWLDGILHDTPVELDAETGGPGDDIRFITVDGQRVELQVKRGLQRGDDLWGALLSLAEGISAGHVDAGILAVCPNSCHRHCKN
ncbi:NB-ARC domain protein, partial [Pseudomonas amygdali]|uniref:NB-ARC domain protein n=4 Tax=Pseudomonas syringae group TaxID=136849 RepID=UPI0001CC2F18